MLYFLGLGLLIPEIPRFVIGPLHQGDSIVGASVAAFSVASVLGRLPLLRVGDRLGLHFMLVAGAITVAAGELVFAGAPSLASVFVMRVLGGFGDALFYTAVTASVIDAVRPELVTRALSVLTSCMFAGMLAGPVAGEAIRSAVGYQSVWWGAAGLSAGAAIVGTAAPRHRLLPAAVTRMGSVAAVRLIALPLGLYVIASVGLAAYTNYVALYAGQLGQRTVVTEFAVLVGGTAVARPAVGGLVERAGPRLSAVGFLLLAGGGLLAAATWPAAAGLIVAAALLAVARALGFPVVMQLAVGPLPTGGRTGVVAAVTAGYDIGYGAAAVGLGPVAGHAGCPAMFGVAALVTLCGAGLALRAIHPPQRKEMP